MGGGWATSPARGKTALGRSKRAGGAGGADANWRMPESIGVGGGAESAGGNPGGHSHTTHEQLADTFGAAASPQQCVWQALQQAGWTSIARAIRCTSGGAWLGHAQALTGSEPIAVATASSRHSTGRQWRTRGIPLSYAEPSRPVNR